MSMYIGMDARLLSEPGFSGLQDFQDWSLGYCSAFDRMPRYCGVGGEWHKLESLCYEEGWGDNARTNKNVRGAMNCATTNAFFP